jgi:Na+-driven multidrug efflux pump
MGMNFIYVLIPAYLSMIVANTFSGVMRGAGDSMGPMWISIISNVILRVPLSFALAYLTRSTENPLGHPSSAFAALSIAIVVSAIITVIYYRRGKWRSKAIVHTETPAAACAD